MRRLFVPLLLVLLTAACSVQEAGYTSPIQHDYAPIVWIPLDQPVEQSFLTGAGIQAAIANDPHTTPDQLRQRQVALPVDIRQARLREITVGLRGTDGPAPVTVKLLNPGGRLVYTATVTADEDRASLPDLPAVPPGEIYTLRLEAAEGVDFGITPQRTPYGGTVASGQDGALLLNTVWQRDFDAGSFVRHTVGHLWSVLRADVGFATGWMLGLATLIGGIVRVATRRRTVPDGR